MAAAISRASGNVVAMPCFGASRPVSCSTREKAPRCSAWSIASGEVPSTGTPASLSRCASPSGVCPPRVQMTPATGPAARSASTTSRTSSKVSGSK